MAIEERIEEENQKLKEKLKIVIEFLKNNKDNNYDPGLGIIVDKEDTEEIIKQLINNQNEYNQNTIL